MKQAESTFNAPTWWSVSSVSPTGEGGKMPGENYISTNYAAINSGPIIEDACFDHANFLEECAYQNTKGDWWMIVFNWQTLQHGCY